MIDTICLLIPKDKAIFLDLKNYGVPNWDLQSKTDEYQKFVKNPSKRDKETGLYFPRLTGYKRQFGQDANIKIEFSVPKLLYKNNLNELSDTDFEEVINTLKERLHRMGVVVDKKILIQASVSSVHFSKNIVLKDGYTASHLISEINKIDLRKSFDISRTRYINDGQSLYAHATSHQFVIYDKIADLGKDKKRAIDKDQTPYQMNLFENIKKQKELFEVLRFEVRLSRKQKMNSVLEKLGYARDPTFQNVFNTEMSKKVVTLYWQTLIRERNITLFTIQMSQKDLLRKIYKTKPNITPNRAIYLTGLILLAKDGNGMRELRSILDKKSNVRTWYRITKELREISEAISQHKIRDWVTQIETGLKNYKPLIYKDYEKIK